MSNPVIPTSEPATRAQLVWLIVAGSVAALALHAAPVFFPMIAYDDFQILVKSLTWPAARDNLWLPANEHAMPLGRLTTWLLVALAGRPTNYPLVTALQGPIATLMGMVLLYLFVRRELNDPFCGLVAMTLFGVSSLYQEAVSWFAASFSVLTLDTILLALLAAQHWRQSRRVSSLVLCVLLVALSSGWFASGILAGPLCCLYLLPWDRESTTTGHADSPFAQRVIPRPVRCVLALSPLLGSALFLAVSLPLTATHILHTPHYGDKTATQAFDPFVGTLNTFRSIADNLALGSFGVSGFAFPLWLVPFIVMALGAALLWWWRPVPRRRLLFLGLGFILLHHLLVYSARADWPYWQMVSWSRYQLMPQLGFALLISGGLVRWHGLVDRLDPPAILTRQQARLVQLLILVLFVVQLPRAILYCFSYDPETHTVLATYDAEQMQVLKRIEEVDARARKYHIPADTARTALGQLRFPRCSEVENGWELLRGSDDPRSMSVEEARSLLVQYADRNGP